MKYIKAAIIPILLLAVLSCSQDGPVTTIDTEGKTTAVVYFSATGNTERIAGYISSYTGGTSIELIPETEYTQADLNWNDSSSRVSREHQNYPNERPAIQNAIDISSYDIIFIGYPIWWGDAPSILLTFLQGADLSGKTVVPFCTSSSSGIGSSAENLQRNSISSGTWVNGRRFSSNASQSSVESWLSALGY